MMCPKHSLEENVYFSCYDAHSRLQVEFMQYARSPVTNDTYFAELVVVLDSAGLAKLCAISPIMHKMMCVHNRMILPLLSKDVPES